MSDFLDKKLQPSSSSAINFSSVICWLFRQQGWNSLKPKSHFKQVEGRKLEMVIRYSNSFKCGDCRVLL